jgi:membrane protease subunit (stomatin/prohibitin family)
MSKRQDREEKVIERLEAENRTLKQINRSLMKRVKKLGRGYRKFMLAQDEGEEQDAVEAARIAAKKMCFQCGMGEYKKVEIANRYFRMCKECGKRGKTKIKEE